MALYENKITLKGYLGNDAQRFTTRQQDIFVILSLATKSGYKDKRTGEWVNHTEWHRVVVFGKRADYANTFKKGDYVQVEGELRSTEFEKEIGDGTNKTSIKQRSWEIRAGIVRKLAQPKSSREGSFDAEPSNEGDAA